MKSIEQRLREAQEQLSDSVVKRINEGCKGNLEKALIESERALGSRKHNGRGHNSVSESITESISPAKAKLVESFKNAGFSTQEAELMADCPVDSKNDDQIRESARRGDQEAFWMAVKRNLF